MSSLFGRSNIMKPSCPQLDTETFCISHSSPHPSVDIRPEAAWDLESFLSPKKPFLIFEISGVSYFFVDFSFPPSLPTPPLSYTEPHLCHISPPYFPSLLMVMNPASSHIFPVFIPELSVINKFSYITVFWGNILSIPLPHHLQPQYRGYRLSIHIFLPPHCHVCPSTFLLALLEPLKGKQF